MISVYTALPLIALGVLYLLYQGSKYTSFAGGVLAVVTAFAITSGIEMDWKKMILAVACIFLTIYVATLDISEDKFSLGLVVVANHIGHAAATIYKFTRGTISLEGMENQIILTLAVGMVLLYLTLNEYELGSRADMLVVAFSALLVLVCIVVLVASKGRVLIAPAVLFSLCPSTHIAHRLSREHTKEEK